MPGLALIISPGPKAENMLRLQHMVDAMKHEPFYSCGTYGDEQAGVYVGWACHPGSYCDCLPVRNGTCDRLLFFYGENHADPEDFQRLRQRGHELNQENAAYVLHLSEAIGRDFLPALNGAFHGFLVDLAQREVMVFNDRFGMQRLYYCADGESALYASEAKALLRVVKPLGALDVQGLAEWFSCGCALENRTLFRGVSLLPPASAWTHSPAGRLKQQTYFQAATWESQPPLSAAEYSAQLEQTFPRILKRYTNGSRPLAMSLTGGLDGRMIMAWARPARGALPCFTFNGSRRECADLRLARKIAAACGQPHETITVGDEFLKQFPRLAEETVYITDGAMDVTGATELYVNRLARGIAPVRLTGNYGSEILRRHVAFKPRALPLEMFSPNFISQLPAAANAYAEAAAGSRLSFIAFKQVPWHHYSRLAIEQSQLAIRSPFLDNELVALAYQAPPELAASLGPSLRLIAQGNPLLARIPTDRGITYPANRMTNRPRRALQEFLAKAEYACDYGMPHWLARLDQRLGPFRLERLFLGRQKFCHFRSWYRHPLADYVRQVLLDPRARSRDYVNGLALERLVDAHTKGEGNYTVEIHKLLSLELLHRTLLEGRAHFPDNPLRPVRETRLITT